VVPDLCHGGLTLTQSLPRVRFTVRRMMVATAIVSAIPATIWTVWRVNVEVYWAWRDWRAYADWSSDKNPNRPPTWPKPSLEERR
jgi:hypothetical protein